MLVLPYHPHRRTTRHKANVTKMWGGDGSTSHGDALFTHHDTCVHAHLGHTMESFESTCSHFPLFRCGAQMVYWFLDWSYLGAIKMVSFA